ncbi:hypothetical protein ND861_11650 [Leptospira sp. 2 VSF19]|uniref:Tetratricopeptide repeat protein n=1 Tax=Leptospira soteropolitanensis TaxID=2950025 RepID=A0AAW5VHP5_9LEPT|nr:hypothetical protein [Leptospira soteropolitanensis]MCW7493040.1 hypothetical protein [Leptospira soteropolitanensis]MCW7500890.1 hypothetical protein [Leptospira soteropolitanensis]MCW7522891.1 hypothetical protein [Leptospira soteropolitanensis]MCW7527003.1 hypothetical protein [Leptospira soteropolitanensis]MCW7530609.1 hypothetical protein [Leptospira soteropolitanensis]
MIQKSEEALTYLSNGEFETAKSLYSVLLDRDPEDLATISGYYIASFWDHRLDLILKTREGKERGKLLLGFFADFESEIRKRGYHTTDSFFVTQDCILKEARDHLKLAYQWEGANALDKDLLRDLAVCLIKIKDYGMALEVLLYGGNKQSPVLQYYLAETQVMTGNEREGIETYRTAFLNDPQLFPHTIVRWPPLLTLIQKAIEMTKKEDEMKELVPVLAWREGIFRPTIKKDETTIQIWFSELKRLADSKERSGGSFRLEARMEQFALAILHSADDIRSRDAVQFAKGFV